VVFPVRLQPEDAAKPIDLKLTVTYGVCKDICVPAEAQVELSVPPNVEASKTIADALSSVPQTGGRAGVDPALVDWKLEADAKAPALILSVDDPSAGDLVAFIEAPDGLFVPTPKRAANTGDTTVFIVDLKDGPKPSDLAGKSLTVTLAGAKGQSETTIEVPK
jgi:DsbC/DsbD-like thiol-disulfide interchange protein